LLAVIVTKTITARIQQITPSERRSLTQSMSVLIDLMNLGHSYVYVRY
jgi:hypothetical protein